MNSAMADYYQEHIKLQESMTKDINKKVRLWNTPGLHIEDDTIPKNVHISKTFVLKVFDLYYSLGVEIEEGKSPVMHGIGDFSSLEELKLRFNHHFELDGNLFAFS